MRISVMVVAILISAYGHAQDPVVMRQNIGFSDFRKLGVDANTYTRCISSVNFAEPEKNVRVAKIGGVVYADDGLIFDLVANDGILTGNKSFPYEQDEIVIPAGEYRYNKQNVIVVDESFAHDDKLASSKFSVKLKCELKWKKCTEWPVEYQALCKRMSWPFTGGFDLNCSLEIIFTIFGT